MKTKLFLLNVIIALIISSCNSERSEYFNSLNQDTEIVVNYTNHKGKKIKILWAIVDGKVDYFTANERLFIRSPNGSFDCRLSKLVSTGPYKIKFESPKNEPALGGEEYYYEVELKFDPPKDPTLKEYFVSGTIYIDGNNTSGLSGDDTSESYDAEFEVYNYSTENNTSKREAETATVNPDDVVNEMKNILDEEVSEKEQPKEEELEDGKYCFQFDDLVNSDEFYYADVTIQNSAVLGNLAVEYESGDGYSATFLGTIEGNQLNIRVKYDNDGGGPYEEIWTISSNNLILEQSAVTLTTIDCE